MRRVITTLSGLKHLNVTAFLARAREIDYFKTKGKIIQNKKSGRRLTSSIC